MTIAFTASGCATHPNCERVLDHICGRLGDHMTVTKSTTGARLETAIGSINMAISSGRIFVDIRCPTAAMLFTIRSMMAEQLYSAANEEPLELHRADGPQASRIPDFREVTVVGARTITPHMRRVTVATHDVQHFSDGGLHVRLLIPPTGREPVWPHTEPDGRIHWPKGEDALTIRAYTIRNIDLVRGHLDIDFVIHEGDNVPGASWALNARVGDRVGLMGPGGGGAPDAQDIFLAGDETALPAIARIMAAAPTTANLRILLEVEDQAEEQELACRATSAVTWVHRNGRPAGTTGVLADAVRQIVRSADAPGYVWAACEQSEARSIRNFMRNESGYDRNSFSIAAYWQRDPS
jgi:NADPH-dependent ferric siderophore reductase